MSCALYTSLPKIMFLFYVWAGKIHITCLVVFIGLCLYVCSQAFHTICFLWKQKHNHFPRNIFYGFHFKVKAFLKYPGWFNLAVLSIIQCLPAAVVLRSLSFKEYKINKAPCKIQTLCTFHLYVSFYIILFCL